MSDGDKLDWIWATTDDASLIARYDSWADSYDEDHDEWGWNGPGHAADALLAHGTPEVVLDAGCGTGRLAVELNRRGWTGQLIGVDLSWGMLERAARLNAYDSLLRGSLHDTSLRGSSVDAVVATGVFTHGHVNHEAFPELIRLVASDGLVVITSREEVWDALKPHAAAIEETGAWSLIDRTEPQSFHPGRDVDDRPQSIISWRVG